MFSGAGLTNVGHHLVQPVLAAGEAKFLYGMTMQSIADAALTEGLATTEEIDILVAALDAFAADPATLVGLPRVFQVWGQTADR